jgi:hypothetical protein
MRRPNFDFHKQTKLSHFVILSRVFCDEELALRSSEGTYAFECAAKASEGQLFLLSITSLLRRFSFAFQKKSFWRTATLGRLQESEAKSVESAPDFPLR